MKRLVYAALVIIVLVAFSLRVVRLTDIPPGLFYDEASDGLDVLRVARGAGFPIFFEANGGREPMFNYLQALAVLLWGPRIFSLRLVAAFAGLASILAVFQVGRVLSLGRKYAPVVGCLTAAAVATSFWHLDFSRLGQRAILLPLFASLSFYFLALARERGQVRVWILSGVFLGLSLYTYTAARFLPLVYLAFFVTEITARPSGFWRWLRPRVLLLMTALVIFAPLGLYFISTPSAFLSRAQDVALGNGAALGDNLGRVAGMFFVRGDLEWRHNLAGRPVLDAITAAPFLAGVFVSLLRWRKRETRLVWLWLTVMLLPSVLSEGAPDLARAIGALPAVYVVVAWGWEAFLNVVDRIMPRAQSAASLTALAIVLLGSGALTGRDYFVRWANDVHTFQDFEGGMTDLANWLNRADTPVYLPIELDAHPTIQFLTTSRFGQVTSPADADSAALISAGGWALPTDPKRLSGAMVALRAGQTILLAPGPLPRLNPTESIIGRRGPLAAFAPVSGDPFAVTQPLRMNPINARFDNHLVLLGYNVSRLTRDRLAVTLYWSATQHPAREPKAFVHLLNQDGAVIAQADELLSNGISPLDWPLERPMPDRHILTSAADASSGRYDLEIGLYDLFNGDRFNVTLADGTSDDHILIASVDLASH